MYIEDGSYCGLPPVNGFTREKMAYYSSLTINAMRRLIDEAMNYEKT